MCLHMPNFRSEALHVFEIYMRVCQILSGSRDQNRAPFVDFYSCILENCPYVHRCTKFEVRSYTRFRDTFEGLPNFMGARDPIKATPVTEFYLSLLEKLSARIPVPNFKSVALFVLEICFKGVPNFIGVK